MDDELSTVCALLHDVVEDTDYTFEDLRKMGFPKDVTDVLSLLTHADGVPYMDYVENLSRNETAKKVKLADLSHNSDLTRLSPDKIDEYALKRTEKYKQAIKFLMEN
jgi:(p)ppGpp synthase/HD superfamily hydrolase